MAKIIDFKSRQVLADLPTEVKQEVVFEEVTPEISCSCCSRTLTGPIDFSNPEPMCSRCEKVLNLASAKGQQNV